MKPNEQLHDIKILNYWLDLQQQHRVVPLVYLRQLSMDLVDVNVNYTSEIIHSYGANKCTILKAYNWLAGYLLALRLVGQPDTYLLSGWSTGYLPAFRLISRISTCSQIGQPDTYLLSGWSAGHLPALRLVNWISTCFQIGQLDIYLLSSWSAEHLPTLKLISGLVSWIPTCSQVGQPDTYLLSS
ncbi:unnamed protein product [Brugia pahangi]|uniref:Alpha/beta hydrolase n=1 Tax=Brugia pahangi TaxID=6280 RepID=A0A0N4TA71_BRUPA|nr:unnamed protein product [Brugia pahangi]